MEDPAGRGGETGGDARSGGAGSLPFTRREPRRRSGREEREVMS